MNAKAYVLFFSLSILISPIQAMDVTTSEPERDDFWESRMQARVSPDDLEGSYDDEDEPSAPKFERKSVFLAVIKEPHVADYVRMIFKNDISESVCVFDEIVRQSFAHQCMQCAKTNSLEAGIQIAELLKIFATVQKRNKASVRFAKIGDGVGVEFTLKRPRMTRRIINQLQKSYLVSEVVTDQIGEYVAFANTQRTADSELQVGPRTPISASNSGSSSSSVKDSNEDNEEKEYSCILQ